MKTLLVTFDYPPMVGGIASLLEELWRRAAGDGAVILAPSGPGAREFDRGYPVRTVRFPSLSGRGFLAKAVNACTGLLWFAFCVLRYRPDVVIAGQLVRAGPLAHAWSKLTGRAFYLWIYGGETDPEFTPFGLTTRHLHRVVRAARVVFTIGPFTSVTMRDFGIPDDRIVEVTPGVNEELSPRPKNPHYVARHDLAGKLVFLTIGRLIERKGIDTMLDALAATDAELPDWRYLIVSDGPYRSSLEAQAQRLGLDGRVTFTGYVVDRQLPIYYNLCDVFVMPNRAARGSSGSSLSVEGFGMVFIDAAACGKPVIAGRSGGAVDALEDGVNGLLVDPEDTDDLCGALRAMADPATRERMGRAGIAFAERFSWTSSARIVRPYLESAP